MHPSRRDTDEPDELLALPIEGFVSFHKWQSKYGHIAAVPIEIAISHRRNEKRRTCRASTANILL